MISYAGFICVVNRKFTVIPKVEEAGWEAAVCSLFHNPHTAGLSRTHQGCHPGAAGTGGQGRGGSGGGRRRSRQGFEPPGGRQMEADLHDHPRDGVAGAAIVCWGGRVCHLPGHRHIL